MILKISGKDYNLSDSEYKRFKNCNYKTIKSFIDGKIIQTKIGRFLMDDGREVRIAKPL